MWHREHPRWHLAIGGGRIQHRDLIEGGRKLEAGASRKEQDVVLMPIGVTDERAEGIEPSQASGIVVGDTPGLPE